MSQGDYRVEWQRWARWPKVLVMRKQSTGETRKYLPESKAKMVQTGYATATCSECECEFMGSIMTNEPPDYVKALERCPRCGAIFEEGE